MRVGKRDSEITIYRIYSLPRNSYRTNDDAHMQHIIVFCIIFIIVLFIVEIEFGISFNDSNRWFFFFLRLLLPYL